MLKRGLVLVLCVALLVSLPLVGGCAKEKSQTEGQEKPKLDFETRICRILALTRIQGTGVTRTTTPTAGVLWRTWQFGDMLRGPHPYGLEAKVRQAHQLGAGEIAAFAELYLHRLELREVQQQVLVANFLAQLF